MPKDVGKERVGAWRCPRRGIFKLERPSLKYFVLRDSGCGGGWLVGFGGVDGRTKGRLVLDRKTVVLFLLYLIFSQARLRRARKSSSSSNSWSGIKFINRTEVGCK